MIHIPMNVSGAVNKQTVLTINRQPGQIPQQNNPEVSTKPIPALKNPVQKGQKIPLENGHSLSKVQARLGWNVTNPSCDVDVSAFLLSQTGKVIGDDWFVFYGQETSPDQSTTFSLDDGADREIISIDLNRLNPAVSKIVFVLTINEALEKRLNFSMLKDAYIRITDTVTGTELVSFRMDEYYSNVTSMMIGEVYRHNGNWKFNAIGNGVARDLAGLCELYGVQVV
jgi:tellurium resistance protein TerD